VVSQWWWAGGGLLFLDGFLPDPDSFNRLIVMYGAEGDEARLFHVTLLLVLVMVPPQDEWFVL
jgi:hypothetical protein